MTTLTSKGYTATVVADPDTGSFHGQVVNIPALLTIAGSSMDEVKIAFDEVIADYEKWCCERDKVWRRRTALSSAVPFFKRAGKPSHG
jgi:predicted HicB family RNase H-like nuclease